MHCMLLTTDCHNLQLVNPINLKLEWVAAAVTEKCMPIPDRQTDEHNCNCATIRLNKRIAP